MYRNQRLVSRKVRNCCKIFGISLALLTGCGISPNGVVHINSSDFDFGQVALSTPTRRIVVTIINPSPEFVSFLRGDTTALANGNIEFDLCNEPDSSSTVEEVTPTSSPQTVWSMTVSGENLYRSNQIPGLYPGVQW
jgi:hypothetical protein